MAEADHKAKDIDGKITDEDIARARAQIGIPQVRHTPTFNRVAGADTMRHFAFGLVGDDNPLWHDENYARGTRWRALIGHPMYVMTLGQNETPRYSEEHKKLFRGLFRGVGKYLVSTRWTFYRPIYEGDVVYEEYTTSAIEEKQSKFAGGRSVIDSYQALLADRAGLPIALREHSLVNAERRGSKEAGKYKDHSRYTYSDEELADIDAHYQREERRGATERFWEDVEVGEALTPVAKGPLTMVDLICRHVATGMADGYNIGPMRFGWKARNRMPAFYTPDDWNVPQVAQRVHWDERRAQDLGLPTGYDYAICRFAWLSHLVTNWIGDDGWLWKFEVELRQFNFLGDFQLCVGEVAGKRIEDGHPLVDLALRAINQRGETTTFGNATVILPSRKDGPVVLPTAPAEMRARSARLVVQGAKWQVRA
jgi:hypothetical protein